MVDSRRDKYECLKKCGAKRSSWIAIRTHEITCTGKPPKSRKSPDQGSER